MYGIEFVDQLRKSQFEIIALFPNQGPYFEPEHRAGNMKEQGVEVGMVHFPILDIPEHIRFADETAIIQ